MRVQSIRARKRLVRRQRARVGFGMENGPAPSEDEHGPAWGSDCRARLRWFGFDPERSAPMLLDESPNIFRRFKSRETNGTGLARRGRPRNADVLNHAVAPIVKG